MRHLVKCELLKIVVNASFSQIWMQASRLQVDNALLLCRCKLVRPFFIFFFDKKNVFWDRNEGKLNSKIVFNLYLNSFL